MKTETTFGVDMPKAPSFENTTENKKTRTITEAQKSELRNAHRVEFEENSINIGTHNKYLVTFMVVNRDIF